MNKDKTSSFTYRRPLIRLIKVASISILILALLLGTAFYLVQRPDMQRKIIAKLTANFQEATGFRLSLSSVDFYWFDRYAINEVIVWDDQSKKLIEVDRLDVDLALRALLMDGIVRLDWVIIEGASVRLVQSATTGDINLNRLLIALQELSKGETKKRKGTAFSIEKADLIDSYFSYHVESEDDYDRGFDPYHFKLTAINAKTQKLRIAADTFEINVKELTTKELKNDIDVKELSTFFRLHKQGMEFHPIHAKINDSQIGDSLAFRYNNISDMSRFYEAVNMEVSLNDAVIYSKDLYKFAPDLSDQEDVFRINARGKGRLASYQVDDLRLELGEGSLIDGRLRLDGLPRVMETFINLRLSDSYFIPEDIMRYLGRKGEREITKLGRTRFKGEFLGFPNDFVANGEFNTALGLIRSDLNLKIDEATQVADYSGSLSTNSFQLNRFLDTESLGKISFNGSVKGTGLTISNADFNLDAKINRFDFNNYTYTNIETRSRLAKELFSGSLSIDDPNLQANTEALIDLRKNANILNLRAIIDTLNFQPLNFINDSIFFSGLVNINSSGLDINTISGRAGLRDMILQRNRKELIMDQLILTFDQIDEGKLLAKCDWFDLALKGDFNLPSITGAFTDLLQEYELQIRNNEDKKQQYYNEKSFIPFVDSKFEGELYDLNPIFDFLEIPIFLSEKTKFEGVFKNKENMIFNLFSKPDSIIFNKNLSLYENEFELNTSKLNTGEEVLAMLNFRSERQKLGTLQELDNFQLYAVWWGEHIDLEAGIKQKTQENIANLRSSIDFLEDTTQIRINEYRLTAIDKEWTLNPNNQILFYGDVIQIDNIKIEHENQSILGSGIISKSSTDSLKIEVKQFDLDNVSPLFQQDYSGDVNGEIYLTGLTDQTLINGSFELNQLFIDEFMVGDILVRTDWSTEEQRLELFFDAFRDQEKFLTVNGFFYPFRRDDQLDFNAQFFDTQLNIIEPFTGGLFSEIQGTLLGEASLKGTFSKPVVKGSGQFNDTSLKVDYLNTVYEAFGRISFDERLIDFNDIKLEDSKGSIANLSGGIRHRNFGNFTMDLSADIQNFMVLNTPLEPNSLYYGTVNASGNISFTGPFSNLSIDAQAKTNRNTRLYIPLGGFSSTRQQDYVTFYSARDQIFGNEEVEETKEEDRRVAVTGLSMNFDLEVTEEAYCEIIYDIKSGDIIRGRGNGNISLQIGSDGEFNMYGDYEISEGAYNFTLYNVINKEFTVEPKSRISWYGDPYDGTVDIKAYYRQLASLAPLFPMEDSAIVNRPEIRRRYPSRVNLNLTGPLMKPDVAFDIEIRDYPDNIIVEGLGSYSLRANVNAFENRIATDEQELKRQVFSLIIIGRFSPQDAFMTGQGGVGNSVSELLSNQLSYWLTQVDENLEIDFDLAGMDQEAFNTFQMRLSYSFLDGRLRITRDGGFTNVQSQTDVYSIAGEWTVEYLLTTDGRFRAKVYNRNNFNAFDPALQNTTNAMAGFSVQYTEGFSNFKELLDSWRGKSRKENRSGFWTEEEENEAIEKEKESQKEEKEKNQSEEAISREEEEEENTD